jgi:hypothetical protein
VQTVMCGVRDGHLTPVPFETVVDEEPDLKVVEKQKVHCLCHKPSHGKMIACEGCSNWYHCRCVNVETSRQRAVTAEWLGPCCETNDSHTGEHDAIQVR